MQHRCWQNSILAVCFSALVFIGASAWGQAGADNAASTENVVYEVGGHVGNLLPHQIPGVTEIMGMGGVRTGMRLGHLSYAEAGYITGNGNGVEWKNAHVDFRMDVPVENLVGMAYIGADMVYYSAPTVGNRLIFGGHAGGGIHTHLAGSVWARADMKFGFSPGTSLYVGFGLEFRFSDK